MVTLLLAARQLLLILLVFLIEDPILQLAKGQTSGSPTVDIGFLGLRGASNNAAFIWDESDDVFAAILTTADGSGTTLTPASYAGFKAGAATFSGTVNISYANPNFNLAQAGAAKSFRMELDGGDDTYMTTYGSGNKFIFRPNSVKAFTIDQASCTFEANVVVAGSGCIGIGTGPAATLHTLVDGGPNEFRMQAHRNDVGQNMFSTQFSRGSAASPAIVQNGDTLLEIQPKGYDGANYHRAAEIDFQVDGTPGTNDMPGRIVFWTTADGASAPTERMRIASTGKISIGNNIPMWSGSYGGALVLKGNNATADRYAQLGIVDSTGTLVTTGLVVANSGNVGIGTTAPSADLEVSTVSGGEFLVTRAGNSGVTLQQVNGGDASSGSLSIKAGTSMSLFTGGVNRLLVDSAGDVGIGTATPDRLLHIYKATAGSVTASSDAQLVVENSAIAAINLLSGSSSHGQILFGDAADNDDGQFGYDQANREFYWKTAGSGNKALKVYANDNVTIEYGKVGIGTTAPQGPLHVVGGNVNIDTTSGARWLTLDAPTLGGYITFETDGTAFADIGTAKGITANAAYSATDLMINTRSGAKNIVFGINGVEKVRIDNNGKVGIGTTAPEVPLVVAGAAGNQAIFRSNQATASQRAGGGFSSSGNATAASRYARMFLDADGSDFSGTDYFSIEKFGNSGEVKLLQYSNANMSFWVNTSTQAMTIKNDGKVGIGTTAPYYQLEVKGTDNNQRLGIQHNTATTKRMHLAYNSYLSGNTNWYGLYTGSTGMVTFYEDGAYQTNVGAIGFSIDRITSDNSALGANPAPKMIITTDGKVGIGTTAPDSHGLHIATISTAPLNSYTGNSQLVIGPAGSTTHKLAISRDTDGDNAYIHSYQDGTGAKNLILQPGGGKVGIGLTNPYFSLHVQTPTGSNGEAKNNALLFDTASATTGTGGGLAFGGFTNGTGGDVYHFGNIQGIKENSTAGNYASAMLFSTRANGATPLVRMRITSAGNVGIGNSSPASLLHVQTVAGGNYTGEVRVGGSNATHGILTSYTQLNATEGSIHVAPGYANSLALFKLRCSTNNTNQLVLKGDGKIGIGTAAPIRQLDLTGSVSGQYAAAFINTSTTGHGVYIKAAPNSASYMALAVDDKDGGSIFVARGDRKVGIGTNSPSSMLNIFAATNQQFHHYTSGSYTSILALGRAKGGSSLLEIKYDSAGAENAYISRAYPNATLHFDKQGTDHMTILSDGKVGIGTTAPVAKLHVPSTNGSKVTKFGDDVTSHYKLSGNSDHTLTLTCSSYYQAEVIITAHQTNGGNINNLYMRGIWSNNHTSHHWDEIENVGSLTNSSFTITIGQNGSTTNSGELKIVHDYVSGTFVNMTVRVVEYYSSDSNGHGYTIS